MLLPRHPVAGINAAVPHILTVTHPAYPAPDADHMARRHAGNPMPHLLATPACKLLSQPSVANRAAASPCTAGAERIILLLLPPQGLQLIAAQEVAQGFSGLLPRLTSGELLLELAAAATGEALSGAAQLLGWETFRLSWCSGDALALA
jgi:hypothetical protein